ncbi:hypothetical protein SAMN05444161_2226 [Rhizobiales bacterium GAS191]|nr:hypothetical protein SAMN05519103_01340 [Rhizobiales bacterium GAS113]SEC97199.1 hypothetical protein SAMN05444161_2226 [Rhizobiales bacterium GAS191]
MDRRRQLPVLCTVSLSSPPWAMTDIPVGLQQFRTIVLTDPALQQELRRAADRPGFTALVIERARERGCVLDAPGVETTLQAAARAWSLRWIER